ncbi:hypothetical protein EON65_01840 [archaeon]|nr:MAG: hypothetical protein EON65_01840 [archaeon]
MFALFHPSSNPSPSPSTLPLSSLSSRLHTLPTETAETGPVCILPTKETFALPRFTKIPEPKPETKWEKFAREKGIKKTKKDRMVSTSTCMRMCMCMF